MKVLKSNKRIIKFIYSILCLSFIYIFFDKTVAEGIIIYNKIDLSVNKNEVVSNEEKNLRIGYSYPKYGKEAFEKGLSKWLDENLYNDYELYYYELDYEKGKIDLIDKKIDLFFTSSNNPMIVEEGIVDSDILYFSEYYALFEKDEDQELRNISNNVELLKDKNIIVIKEDGEIIERIAESSATNAPVYIVNDLQEAINKYEENKEKNILIIGSWRTFDLLSHGYDLERIFPEYKISSATVEATVENAALINNINRVINLDSNYFKKLVEDIENEKKKEIFNSNNILNEDEKNWIDNNDEIVVKIIQYREPMLFKDENGDFQGFIVDIMKGFSDLTNIKVKYEDYLYEFKKQNLSYIAKLSDNEIYALNFNTKTANEEFFERYIDVNSKIGIVHKESNLKSLNHIYNDLDNPIGVIYGSPSQRYFDDILMKNYKIYYNQRELINDFNENKIKYFSTLEMNFFEIQLNYDEVAFFKELESVRSYPMFLFSKGSLNYSIFKKAMRFINWYGINDYWQNNMNSKINEKTNARFNETITLTKLNTFAITLAIMLLIIASMVIRFSIKSRDKNKQLENALNKLEMAQKAKNLFFANMSHEIRTPIYTILGMNYFLKKSKTLTNNEKKYLNNIEVAGNMLMSLVNDVLDYSKIEEKKINIENKTFKLKDLEDEIIAIFNDRIKCKGLDFIIKSNYDEALIIECDKLRLCQVIVNLISNAFKFTEEGSITLEIELINDFEKESLIEFSVTDTGIGIDENKLDIIWEDFQQIHNDLSENHNGTGLGLAICKRIIEALGGKVWVTSNIGKGSTFGFTLLIKKGHINLLNLSDTNEECNELIGKKILVVEDNIINLEIALNILQELGIICDEATNGEEAIELCRNKNNSYYDLILMDINMPKMNGYDAVKILRDEYKVKSPIAFMTATILDELKEKEFKEYINGVILKPVDPDDIKDKILKIINRDI